MIKYSDDKIREAVQSSTSWAQVFQKTTGINRGHTGHQSHFKHRAVRAGIDFSHFTGQGWSRGKKFGPKKLLNSFLVINGPSIKSNDLKLRLIKEGLKQHQCEKCSNQKWLGCPIPIELDHINSNIVDNRLENLQILCPNCHAIKTALSRRGGKNTQ